MAVKDDVSQALADYPEGLTGRELAEITGWASGSVYSAVSELMAEHRVVRCELGYRLTRNSVADRTDFKVILATVQRSMAETGMGLKWTVLIDRYGYSQTTLSHMVEAGLLRRRGSYYEPGPALESVTTRQLTPEERRNLEAGLPSSGEPPRAGYIWWTRGGVA